MKFKEGKTMGLTKENIVSQLAKGDQSSEDELEGRSVHQEIDYSDKKRAMKEIKKANYDQIQKQKQKKMNLKNFVSDGASNVTGMSLHSESRRSKNTAISSVAKSIIGS